MAHEGHLDLDYLYSRQNSSDRILMTSFDTENISILKFCGERFDGLKATVRPNQIKMSGKSPLIEMGDLVVCAKPNGAEDVYRVLDPGFYEGWQGVPAGYRMSVHKLAFLSKPAVSVDE